VRREDPQRISGPRRRRRPSVRPARRGSPIYEISRHQRSPAGRTETRDVMTHRTRSRVRVPTYMRNTYPGVGSVLRAIIACRPEDSLRPVLSYPSSPLAIVPRQTHDRNPSFPFHLPDSLSPVLASAYPALTLVAALVLSLSLSSRRISARRNRFLLAATCRYALLARQVL